jgi:hypothetical protein
MLAETTDQAAAELSQPVSRLAELRSLRAEKGFDPHAIIIDAIKHKGRGALKLREKAQAAEGLARLELDYEKLELAKKHPPARGMRGSISTPDGQMSLEFQLDDISDEELEERARRKAAELGLVVDGGS